MAVKTNGNQSMAPSVDSSYSKKKMLAEEVSTITTYQLGDACSAAWAGHGLLLMLWDWHSESRARKCEPLMFQNSSAV